MNLAVLIFLKSYVYKHESKHKAQSLNRRRKIAPIWHHFWQLQVCSFFYFSVEKITGPLDPSPVGKFFCILLLDQVHILIYTTKDSVSLDDLLTRQILFFCVFYNKKKFCFYIIALEILSFNQKISFQNSEPLSRVWNIFFDIIKLVKKEHLLNHL